MYGESMFLAKGLYFYLNFSTQETQKISHNRRCYQIFNQYINIQFEFLIRTSESKAN